MDSQPVSKRIERDHCLIINKFLEASPEAAIKSSLDLLLKSRHDGLSGTDYTN
jgi:hypothetical protein